jgi:hypothetical protein
MKLTFPIVIDSTGEVARDYGVRFTPTHFLIDHAGVVRAGGSGSKDWNSPAAHAVVRVLLDPKPANGSSPVRNHWADSPRSTGAERR